MKKRLILESDGSHDEDLELQRALNAVNYYLALCEIREKVFRPHRKHLYGDQRINDLIEKLGEDSLELIGMLEKLFSEVVNDYAPGEGI